MPMPWTYRHSAPEFRGFLDDLKDRMGLVSDNSAFTAVEGVFLVYRRRVAPQQALDFATVLPSVPRAIFVAGWSLAEPNRPWADRSALTAEAKAHRKVHNLTPDNCIEAAAFALRRAVDQRDLDRVLRATGPEAVAFWTSTAPPQDLTQRFR